jgi:hypothetical protein
VGDQQLAQRAGSAQAAHRPTVSLGGNERAALPSRRRLHACTALWGPSTAASNVLCSRLAGGLPATAQLARQRRAIRRATPHPLSHATDRVRATATRPRATTGFGRIGRNFLRCLETRTDSLLDVVAINDSGGVKQVRGASCVCGGGGRGGGRGGRVGQGVACGRAVSRSRDHALTVRLSHSLLVCRPPHHAQASHLLKYDSTLGKFDAEVKVVDDSHISVNGKSIKVRGGWRVCLRACVCVCVCVCVSCFVCFVGGIASEVTLPVCGSQRGACVDARADVFRRRPAHTHTHTNTKHAHTGGVEPRPHHAAVEGDGHRPRH